MIEPIVTTDSLNIQGALMNPSYMANFRRDPITFESAFEQGMPEADRIAVRYGFTDAAEVMEYAKQEFRPPVPSLVEKIRGVTPEELASSNKKSKIAREILLKEI